jgi:hypothetical protein
MPNFTVELVGPWLGRRQLLNISPAALADQGARVRLALDQHLGRKDINTHPADDSGVRIRVVHRAPDKGDGDLIDLAAAVEPYVLDALERRGICTRDQIYEIAHRFERRAGVACVLVTVEGRPE